MISSGDIDCKSKSRISSLTFPQNNFMMPHVQLHCTVCCILQSDIRNSTLNPDGSKPNEDDLFRSFRHFLRFGKFFGVVPFDGVFAGELSQLRFRWKSPGTIYSCIVVGMLFVNVVIALLGLLRFGGRNATEWAWSAESFVFYSMGIFTHFYFMLRGKGLIVIFKKWSELELDFFKVDKNLSRDVNLIAGIIYTSAILENVLLQIIFLAINNNPEDAGKAPLERYYVKAQTHWSAFVPYHEGLAILIFFTNKLALYAWNFVDILSIMMSRALYYKFKALNSLAYERLVNSESSCMNPETWKKLVKDHELVCNLVQAFSDFLSPLLFASYAINCFYICLQLHLGLTAGANNSILQRIYAIWSFVHLIVRVFLVSLSAAKINDHAHKIMEILYSCPESCESREVERTRFKLASTKIGLSGLGCFVITRPFVLKIISVIFTFEIVLLQAPGPSASCKPS